MIAPLPSPSGLTRPHPCTVLTLPWLPLPPLSLQVDPALTRTVLVSTKFDTKLPQFSRGSDVDLFLHPTTALGLGDAAGQQQLGGSPFFT